VREKSYCTVRLSLELGWGGDRHRADEERKYGGGRDECAGEQGAVEDQMEQGWRRADKKAGLGEAD
jgi:hypothetical protein